MNRSDLYQWINTIWATTSLFAAGAFVIAARNMWQVGHRFQTLRFPLAVALAMISTGDAVARGIASFIWDRRSEGAAGYAPEDLVVVIHAAGLLCVAGIILAVRSVTKDQFGELAWITCTIFAILLAFWTL
jgi:hypothetical protein